MAYLQELKRTMDSKRFQLELREPDDITGSSISLNDYEYHKDKRKGSIATRNDVGRYQIEIEWYK